MALPVSLLVEALSKTATRLERIAYGHGLSYVNEQSHLDPHFRQALNEVALSSASAYRFSKPKVATGEWPRLGSVDVGIEDGDGELTLVELKSGKGKDALGPCAWDAAKLAYLLEAGAAADAFLVAGTTLANWEAPIRGAEFFTNRAHDLADLRVSYADWWRKWERDGYPAAPRMPAWFETEFVAEASFTVPAEPWLLRMSRVGAAGPERIDWPPLLAT